MGWEEKVGNVPWLQCLLFCLLSNFSGLRFCFVLIFLTKYVTKILIWGPYDIITGLCQSSYLIFVLPVLIYLLHNIAFKHSTARTSIYIKTWNRSTEEKDDAYIKHYNLKYVTALVETHLVYYSDVP